MSKKLKITPHSLEKSLAGIPPTPAIKHIPDWYKDLPPFTNGDTKLRFPFDFGTHNTGLKRCIPFLDAMTAGYIFVLDDDIYVEQTSSGPTMRWKSPVDMITMHSPEQYEGIPTPKGYHSLVGKWHNEYRLETSPGYSMMFMHPVNRFDLPFRTITGFVDTDSYSSPVQFPFFLEEGFEGMIESGTPVAQMIPVKRDSWESNLGKYDKDESYKIDRGFSRTFAGSYKKNFWNKKSYS